MRGKRILILAVLFLCIEMGACFMLLQSGTEAQLDTTEVNRIVKECGLLWNETDSGQEFTEPEADLRYAVTDLEGRLIYRTDTGVSASLNEAVAHRDTIVDIEVQGEEVGKLLIYNDSFADWQRVVRITAWIVAGSGVLMLLMFLIYRDYLNRTVFAPFEDLKRFASQVANGDLELPLLMDRGNAFGAFTESFDLMREELKTAKEQERAANQSKKELVAKLSHDIKTPVASIKAVSELLEVSGKTKKEQEWLKIIDTKADQIDNLISNMFQATLEELKELKVVTAEHESGLLLKILAQSDYQQKAGAAKMPECLVCFDELRMQQVVDNVIGNVYKYAGTAIEIGCSLKAEFLVIRIRDFGPGAEQLEVPLLTVKFFRGENAKGKSGTGLGLFISRYLMEEMGGVLDCGNWSDGFMVTLSVPLAGR